MEFGDWLCPYKTVTDIINVCTFPPPGFIQPSLGNGLGEMDRRQWLIDEGEEARKGNCHKFNHDLFSNTFSSYPQETTKIQQRCL